MYTIYIDGSHHYKSHTSGWGFVVYENNKLIHESYGKVPKEFSLEYEQFAYAKALYFIQEKNIKKSIIYTDLKILEKQHENMTYGDIIHWAQHYVPHITVNTIVELKTIYIERKFNKVADRLSRRFLLDLYEKERNDFLLIHGRPKERKVNFFHMDYLDYSLNRKHIEKKVLHAVKKEHLILSVKNNVIQIYKEKNKIKDLIATKNIESEEDIIKELEYYGKNYKKILLAIPAYPQLFDDIIYHAPRVSHIIDSLTQLFVYNKTVDNPYQSMRVASKKNYEYPMNEILEKAKSSNRYFQVLIGRDITHFKNNNGRTPNKEELSSIINSRKLEIQKT